MWPCGKPSKAEAHIQDGRDSMDIERIHHVAYRCKDAKATVQWY